MTFGNDKRKSLDIPFEERMAKIFKEANLFFDQDSTREGTNDPPENENFIQKEMIDGNGAKCKACEELESKFSSVIERLEKQNKVIENLRKENSKMAVDFESQIKVKKEIFNENLQKNKTDFDLQLSNVIEERDYLIEENKFNDNSIKNLMEKCQKLDGVEKVEKGGGELGWMDEWGEGGRKEGESGARRKEGWEEGGMEGGIGGSD